MSTSSITWTAPMRQALTDLRQDGLLPRLLSFATARGVILYVVGGTIRDVCLGRPVHDVDLAMRGDSIRLAQAFANDIGAAYVPMDLERGEARVVYRKRQSLDFARLRGDTISADLAQRDFAINAMACPLGEMLSQERPEIIDPHHGWTDLQAHRVRMVSSQSFGDDPLRLLRAFRLAAALNFSIDPATLEAMLPVVPRLSQVAMERVQSELLQLFATSQSSAQVSIMAALGLLDVLFPEWVGERHDLPASELNRDQRQHALRTYQAIEELMQDACFLPPTLAEPLRTYFRAEERRALVKWAALWHTIVESPVASAAATPGPQSWEEITHRLKLSGRHRDYLQTLLTHHGRALELADLEAQGGLTLRRLHGWCRDLGDRLLGVLALALGHVWALEPRDTNALRSLEASIACIWELYHRRILPVLTARRLVSGDDLQHLFHLTPGPRFKVLLDELEVAQVEGRIHNRAEALQWLEEQCR